jgi:fibronectin-binding autotransporter adhesin
MFSISQRTKRVYCCAVGILLLSFLAGSAPAAAIEWSGDVSPSDPTTWTATTDAEIGHVASGTGSVTINSGGSLAALGAQVGSYGDGTLNINGGGTLTLGGSGWIGTYAGSVGVATVSGSDSSMTASSDLYVGTYGTSQGSLTIQDGASVEAGKVYIARYSGAHGEVNISGGSTLDGGLEIYVGYGSSTHSGSGTLTIDGPGSSATAEAWVCLGRDGADGTMTLTNGASISNNAGYVNYNDNSTSTATLEGGSSWTNTNSFKVATYGTGTLHIRSGSSVTSSYGDVGEMANSNGLVNIDGAGSQWRNNTYLNVGHGAGSNCQGTVNITNGGLLSNGRTSIGQYSGGTGTVTVDGDGSLLTTRGSTLYVGQWGTGTMTVSNGAAVQCGDAYVGYDSAATGNVTIEGSGTAWNVSGSLTGGAGNATLTIRDDAMVLVGGVLDWGSFVNMSRGGQLALVGSAGDLTGFLTLISGDGVIRYWNGAAWSNITNATVSDYSVVAMTSGDLDGYSVLTVTAVPEPATMSLLALGGLALLRRRKK